MLQKVESKLWCLNKESLGNFDEWKSKTLIEGGLGLFDKDKGWTSFDVVAKARKLIGIKKVGHCGSLDPLATGLLILSFGKATKITNTLVSQKKQYSGIIKLGACTNTDDREGKEIINEKMKEMTLDFNEKKLENVRKKFIGKIKQIPPLFSAKKLNGKRMYKLAREGKLYESICSRNDEKLNTLIEYNLEIDIRASEVEIYDLKFIKYEKPYLEIEVVCSKGTYIRAIARDIGKELGCGGYLYKLRRLKIGDYSVDEAISISDLKCVVNGML